MATVTFGQLWIGPAADPASALPFSVHGIEHNPVDSVGTTAFAGGNFRVVRQKGIQKTARVDLKFCTDTQAAQLKAWQGQVLLYRDPTGEKFYGVISNPTFTPRKVGDSWVVPLTVAEVTVSEEV